MRGPGDPHLKNGEDTEVWDHCAGNGLRDLHDIGKTWTKLLLETSGFRVVDLGGKRAGREVSGRCKRKQCAYCGAFIFVDNRDPHVEETIHAIKNSDLADRVKVICGGAAVTLKLLRPAVAMLTQRMRRTGEEDQEDAEIVE